MKNGNYVLVKAPENYPGKKYRDKYVYEHRLVWWLQTAELAENFDIHSIHASHHGFECGNDPVKKVCQQCSVEYIVPFNSRNRKFCSRPCQYESFRVISSVEL